MQSFYSKLSEAALTSIQFFWMAFWAFALGYLISSIIQVFVTPQRMKKLMGKDNVRSVSLGAFFGFISSSCSFSALATTKSLFKKGAGFVSSISFLLASTNLVIELGVMIAIFLSWQFVVGEYVGGILLILISWLIVKLSRPKKLIKQARERLKDESDHHTSSSNWKEEIRSIKGWKKVAMQYFMEWKMVWKDVLIGFTVAGVISAFVPKEFFESLFINSGSGADYTFLELLQHSIVGPVAAFFTFIGSMGNIPLAAVLYNNDVSFAGIMAFIFSDLVVLPVLRVNAKFYGWKMALYILLLLLISLVVTSLLLHYGMSYLDILPQAHESNIATKDHFQINYTFFLNIGFFIISSYFAYIAYFRKDIKVEHMGHNMASSPATERILLVISFVAIAWLAVGLIV